MRRPDGEAGLGRAGIARRVHRAEGVDVHDVDVRRTRRQLGLGQRVDLRAGEAVTVPRIGVGGQVDAVGIRTDVRVVAEERTGVHTTGVGAVVGDVDLVDVPGPGR